jgi:hypothetical protein
MVIAGAFSCSTVLNSCTKAHHAIRVASAEATGFRTTAIHVRRDKAALLQRVQDPPDNRSSRKQPEQAWR